jgi:hypothetical protein
MEIEQMVTKLSKKAISDLMAWWGHKGGSRATDKQKQAALANLKKTPNHQRHLKFAEEQAAREQNGG